MRYYHLAAAALLAVCLASTANAAELRVFCPPLVRDGLTKLAAAFTAQTGTHVTVKSEPMGKLVTDVRTGTPDVVLLPVNLMDVFGKDGGVRPGSRVSLVRVRIGLAVRAGAPHPDISTVAKTIAALKQAEAVTYSQPGPPRNSMEGGIIDHLLKQPQFAGVHTLPMPPAKGSGIMALVRGEADMALQVISEILPHKEVELVGPLPPALGAHIDVDAATSIRAADPADAAAFVRYIARPQAAAAWKAEGIDLF